MCITKNRVEPDDHKIETAYTLHNDEDFKLEQPL